MFYRALAATLLLATLAFADVDPDFAEDILDEAQLDEPLYKPNLRHGSHKHAFLKYGHHLDQVAENSNSLDSSLDASVDTSASLDSSLDASVDTSADSIADLEDSTLAAPMALPGRYPSVEKALDGMEGDLQNLQEKQQAAKNARGELEGSVTDTFHHLNDAVSIKQAMSKKQAELRRENGKVQHLEDEEAKLDNTHNNLVSSLHRMLGPKLMFARERFQKKEKMFHKEEQAEMAWKQKRDQLKSSAMEHIKKKKESHSSLLQAEEEVAQAKKKEQLARIQYEHDRTTTAEEVQSYRYAETRFKAEMQHEKNAKAAANAAHESVGGLHRVYDMEQQKVEQSIGVRKQRLEHKIREVQEARQKSSQELSDLEQRYKDWEEMQRARTAAVVKQSQDTEAASEAYAAGQKQVLNSAAAKVVRDAEMGDWDGWGNDFTKATDELDD